MHVFYYRRIQFKELRARMGMRSLMQYLEIEGVDFGTIVVELGHAS